jgi:hypothetical protein
VAQRGSAFNVAFLSFMSERDHNSINALAAARDGLWHTQAALWLGSPSGGSQAFQRYVGNGWMVRQAGGVGLGRGMGRTPSEYRLTDAGRAYLNEWLAKRGLPICP